MAETTREERLQTDLEALMGLKEASTIFDFDSTGNPPDRYTLVFRGKGITRDTSARSDIEFVQLHRCDIRLPYSYPERGPDISWLTPIFHPNISFSGFVNLREIGLPWERDITLDIVCERLWDIARMAYINDAKSSNYSARNWLEDESTLRLPIDHRPLRDKKTPAGKNVIRYKRRGGKRAELPPASDADVLYIGDDTPAPDTPQRHGHRLPGDDEDILYIGE